MFLELLTICLFQYNYICNYVYQQIRIQCAPPPKCKVCYAINSVETLKGTRETPMPTTEITCSPRPSSIKWLPREDMQHPLCQPTFSESKKNMPLKVKKNDNNINVSIHSAVIMTTAIARVHRVHLINADSEPDGCRSLKSSQPTWTVSLLVGCCCPNPPSLFIITTQPKCWYSFYHLWQVES